MKPRLQEKGGKYECVQSSGDCRETKFEKAMTICRWSGPPISTGVQSMWTSDRGL